jgi:O-methyltransferase
MKSTLIKIVELANQVINPLGLSIDKHYPSPIDHNYPKDYEQSVIEIIQKVKPYTMTSTSRLFSLCEAVKYIVNNQIPGDIVECGVWRGGSMMAIAETLHSLHDISRDLYLFDTFEGMTEPTEQDISSTSGISAKKLLSKIRKDDSRTIWCYASLNAVKDNMSSTDYPASQIHFIKGRVEDTIPEKAPEKISLLRLDTDWYESTRHEMHHLFPRISKGGVIILDDYGWWEGSRQAVDEYIKENNIRIFLNRIDLPGRIGVVL